MSSEAITNNREDKSDELMYACSNSCAWVCLVLSTALFFSCIGILFWVLSYGHPITWAVISFIVGGGGLYVMTFTTSVLLVTRRRNVRLKKPETGSSSSGFRSTSTREMSQSLHMEEFPNSSQTRPDLDILRIASPNRISRNKTPPPPYDEQLHHKPGQEGPRSSFRAYLQEPRIDANKTNFQRNRPKDVYAGYEESIRIFNRSGNEQQNERSYTEPKDYRTQVTTDEDKIPRNLCDEYPQQEIADETKHLVDKMCHDMYGNQRGQKNEVTASIAVALHQDPVPLDYINAVNRAHSSASDSEIFQNRPRNFQQDWGLDVPTFLGIEESDTTPKESYSLKNFQNRGSNRNVNQHFPTLSGSINSVKALQRKLTESLVTQQQETISQESNIGPSQHRSGFQEHRRDIVSLPNLETEKNEAQHYLQDKSKVTQSTRAQDLLRVPNCHLRSSQHNLNPIITIQTASPPDKHSTPQNGSPVNVLKYDRSPQHHIPEETSPTRRYQRYISPQKKFSRETSPTHRNQPNKCALTNKSANTETSSQQSLPTCMNNYTEHTQSLWPQRSDRSVQQTNPSSTGSATELCRVTGSLKEQERLQAARSTGALYQGYAASVTAQPYKPTASVRNSILNRQSTGSLLDTKPQSTTSLPNETRTESEGNLLDSIKPSSTGNIFDQWKQRSSGNSLNIRKNGYLDQGRKHVPGIKKDSIPEDSIVAYNLGPNNMKTSAGMQV